MLEHRPGGAAVSANEDVAITEIDAAIGDIDMIEQICRSVPDRHSVLLFYPGYSTSDSASSHLGVTPAGGGAATPGNGGVQAGCTGGGNNSVRFSDSVAGSKASGAVGGTVTQRRSLSGRT